MGSTTVTASAPGYANGLLPVTVSPSGFVFTGLGSPITVDAFAANQNYVMRLGILNDDGSYFTFDSVRGGASIPVVVTSSNAAAGTIVNSPVTFTSNVSFVERDLRPGRTRLDGRRDHAAGGLHGDHDGQYHCPHAVDGERGRLGGAVRGALAATVGRDLQTSVSVRLQSVPPAAVDLTLSVPAGSGVLLS